jgi:apyrase
MANRARHRQNGTHTETTKRLPSASAMKGSAFGTTGNYRAFASTFNSINSLGRHKTRYLFAIFLVFLTGTFLIPSKLFSGNEPIVPGVKVSPATSHEGAAGDDKYAVVIDAGSTGSRVHVFKFLETSKGELELQSDDFEQLKPGLSAYADKPEDAAKSLKPLLQRALKVVPKSMQSSTPIMVGATAGLRLLPNGKADIILDHVRKYLEQFPFTSADGAVTILSGQSEGAFAWLTLNYLLGNLGKPFDETVAAIDLGGGSVQQAFAMGPTEIKEAPKPDYITKLKGGGKEYSVYVHSYLGYGLMAARAAVLEIDLNGPEDDSHPCIHEGFKGKYTYGEEVYQAQGKESVGAQYDQCMVSVLTALNRDEKCGAPQPQCSFQGAWRGSRIPDVFYVSSYFWDRAADAGLLDDDKDTHAVVSPRHFKNMAEDVCDLDVKSVQSKYSRLQEEHSPYFCLDLTYAHTLLTGGFNIPDEQEITLVKKVKYRGEYVEVAWALGAGINMLS